MRVVANLLVVLGSLSILLICGVSVWAGGDFALNAGQLVEIAVEVNPQVKAAKAQWEAAQHQILQNYAPADPTFNYVNVDSNKDFNAATKCPCVQRELSVSGRGFAASGTSEADRADCTPVLRGGPA